MQIPEQHLRQFNKKSLKLLRASLVALECDKDQDELLKNLKNCIRKTQVVQLLSEHIVVAISGLQGVGKSTLVKQIYAIGVDEYFPENLSRGENIPILITEGKDFHTEVCRFNVGDGGDLSWTSVSAYEFKQIAMDPGENDLLLRLTVPRQYDFPEEFSFLLLPGFEPGNSYWQELMRYALKASMTCVFVFNQQKYPLRENVEALTFIRESFRESSPVYVLTRSDQADDGNKGLRERVCKDLEVSDHGRVICTGTDDSGELKKKWIPEFIAAVRKYGQTPARFRTTQLASLQELLHKDFGKVILQFKAKVGQLKLEQGSQSHEIRQMLDSFDGSVKRTKKIFLEIQREALDIRTKKAISQLKEQFQEQGRWERIWKSICEWVTGPEHPLDIEGEISSIWNNCLEYDSKDEQLMVMNQLINRRLKLYGALPSYENYKESFERKDLHERSLMLKEADGEEAGFSRQEIQADLRVLFLPKCKDDHFSDDLRKTIQLLPALALEYTRLGIIVPPMLESKTENKELLSKRLEPVLAEFDILRGQNAKVIAGIAVMLGIDAEDGTIDSIPALVQALGFSVTGTAVPIATAAAGLVGATLMISSLLNHLKKNQIESDYAKLAMIGGIFDQLLNVYEEKFDSLIATLREVLEERLSDRYQVHAGFGRTEAFFKALNDVDECRKKFLDATAYSIGSPLMTL